MKTDQPVEDRFEVPSATKQSVLFRKNNTYKCIQCSGEMDSREDGIAECQSCGIRAGDASRLTDLAGLDFVHVPGPRGWQPVEEVSQGLARMTAKPDPSSDPRAVEMREAVEKRRSEAGAGEVRRIEQLEQSTSRKSDEAAAKSELRDNDARRRAFAAKQAPKFSFRRMED